MKVYFFFFIVVITLAECRTTFSEPIPRDVFKTIAYLVIPSPQAKTTDRFRGKPAGTGFFVSHKYADAEDPNRSYVFLVTARHVIIDMQTGKRRLLLLRMNETPSGKARDITELQPDKWVVHDNEESVDLAVYPLSILQGIKLNLVVVTSSDFVTQETLTTHGIGIGDEVFYAGLLPLHPGTKRIVPIARFGRLALTTDEKTTVDIKVKNESGKVVNLYQHLYLHFLDADVVRGHSGSPVFLWATAQRQAGNIVAGPRPFGLYGVVSIGIIGGGVTGIVPVKFLRQILESNSVRVASGLPAKN